MRNGVGRRWTSHWRGDIVIMRRGKRRDFVNMQPRDRGMAEVALKR